MIENIDKMIYIYGNEVNNISEFNLIHDIIHPTKCAKNINIHYSPILHGCMNTRKGRAKFKNYPSYQNHGTTSTI